METIIVVGLKPNPLVSIWAPRCWWWRQSAPWNAPLAPRKSDCTPFWLVCGSGVGGLSSLTRWCRSAMYSASGSPFSRYARIYFSKTRAVDAFRSSEDNKTILEMATSTCTQLVLFQSRCWENEKWWSAGGGMGESISPSFSYRCSWLFEDCNEIPFCMHVYFIGFLCLVDWIGMEKLW